MLKTGDTPGKGTYKCLKCGKIITLENDTDALPVCPRCGNKTWEKVEE